MHKKILPARKLDRRRGIDDEITSLNINPLEEPTLRQILKVNFVQTAPHSTQLRIEIGD